VAEASVEGSKAALQVANAQVEIADVEILRAGLDFKRFEDLFDKGAGTQQELDESDAAHKAANVAKKGMEANVKTAEAEQKKAEANLVQVELDFGYTTVRAPISGVVTKTEVKVGNLVENGTLLASVVDRTRIFANFNISDREALRLDEARRAKSEPDDQKNDRSRFRTRPAFLSRSNDSGFPFEGLLEYIDQEGIDQSTGTLAIRCVFENPDDLLMPGLFVYVRVPVGELKDALLIPERALFRDQTGSFVLTVNDEKKIERNPVTVGQTADGMVVIKEGLSPEDWIVLEGSQRARPGVEVSPQETEISRSSDDNKQSSKVEETDGDASASEEKSDDSDSQK
jgi:RND family efflux transporter MFP subunit